MKTAGASESAASVYAAARRWVLRDQRDGFGRMNDVSPVRFAALCRRPQGTVAARVSTRAGAGPAAGLLAVLALLLAGATPRAAAGGPFVRLIGVGANGAWRELRLAR